MKALVVQANALRLPLADASVDLIVTSPPYFALRSYRDGDEHYAGQIGSEATPAEFLEALWAATREMVRVLKPSGSIFVNLGDKYAGSGGHNNNGIGASTLGHHKGGGGPHSEKMQATRRNAPDRYNQNSGGIPAKSLMGLPWRYANGCVDQLGLILRRDLIWDKPNGLPESVTDRCRTSHEYWFHFTRQGRYFSAVDEVREAHAESSLKSWPTSGPNFGGNLDKRNDPITQDGHRGTASPPNPLGKLPGSVWRIPSEPLLIPEAALARLDLPDHFAAFPQEWPRRLILGWSPSGICTACGEGRRPVVATTPVSPKPFAERQASNGGRSWHGDGADMKRSLGYAARDRDRAISGYACACSNDSVESGQSLPPTRPAVVLDPFGGTGTTAMVARALGRIGISVDLSHAYGRLARWRIFESDAWHKAEARTWAERQGAML